MAAAAGAVGAAAKGGALMGDIAGFVHMMHASPGGSKLLQHTCEPCMLARRGFRVSSAPGAHRLSVRNRRLLFERSPFAIAA